MSVFKYFNSALLLRLVAYLIVELWVVANGKNAAAARRPRCGGWLVAAAARPRPPPPRRPLLVVNMNMRQRCMFSWVLVVSWYSGAVRYAGTTTGGQYYCCK